MIVSTKSKMAAAVAKVAANRPGGDVRPLFHLHASDELVAAVLGAEKRGFPLFDIEPVLAECIDDVRLVRNENGVGVRRQCGAQQFVKSGDTAVVLVRRHHETAGSLPCCVSSVRPP